MKRKNFKQILFKYIIVAISIAIVLLIVVGLVASQIAIVKTKENYVKMLNYYTEVFQTEYIIAQNSNNSLSGEELKNNIYDHMSIRTSIIFDDSSIEGMRFSSMAIYDEEKRNLICESEKRVWIEMTEKDTHYEQIIFCHPSSIYKIEKDDIATHYVRVKDYYEIDNRYYLGNIELSAYVDGDVIKVLNLAPEDTKEYQRIEMNDTEKYFFGSPEIYGPSKENTDLNELHEYISRTDDFGYTGCEYEINGFNIFIKGYMNFMLPDGDRYIMFSSANVDLFKYYGEWILLVGILIPVVAVLAGLLMAYIKFIGLRAQYTMEDYRRTLTDEMAHDLKSPLMAISGYSENLKDNINTEKKEYYADTIINNVSYMNGIITNVLELSKLESGKIVPVKNVVNLNTLLKTCQEKYEGLIENKTLTIEYGVLPDIKGDENLLMQAFDNLLSNAIKYSEPYSIIEIKAMDGRIIIVNTYNQEEDIRPDDLWKPFVKGDNARSNKNGTGIGLTIAKNIFEMHGFKQKILCNDGKFMVEIKL